MKNLLKFALIAVFLLNGCAIGTDFADTNKDALPEIDTTYIGQEHFASDEWLIVPLEDLPFQIQIPSWWNFSEDADAYTLAFDDGVLGEIILSKTAANEEFDELDSPVHCYEEINHGESCAYINDICTEKKCLIGFDEMDEKYPLTIWDKGLDERQWETINELLLTLELD